MDNIGVVCPWIRSMSKCVFDVVSELVTESHFCHEVVGCSVLGGHYHLCYLLCFRDCCIICSWS